MMRGASLLVSAVVALGMSGSAGSAVVLHSDRDRSAGPDSARVEALLGALHAADPMVCEMVVDQVGNFWNSSGAFRLGLLGDGSRSWESARDSLYGRVTNPAAIRRLARGLDDPNPCTRRVSAKLLGRGLPGTLPIIRESLRSTSERIREAAALAAGQDDTVALGDDLIRATRDPSVTVVAMATWALGERERPEYIGRLGELAHHDDPRVRRAAANSLGRIDHVPARLVPVLLPLLKDSDAGVRYFAAHGLGNQEDPQAAPDLAQLLNDPDRQVRYAAAEALSDLDDLEQAPPGVVAELGRALGDPDWEFRRAIVEAMAHIPGDLVTPHLIRALKDAHPEVRKAAAEALGHRR